MLVYGLEYISQCGRLGICSYCQYKVGRQGFSDLSDVHLLVVLASLYLLGLYEDNTCNFLPFLFTTDYSNTLIDIFCFGQLSLTHYLELSIELNA